MSAIQRLICYAKIAECYNKKSENGNIIENVFGAQSHPEKLKFMSVSDEIFMNRLKNRWEILFVHW